MTAALLWGVFLVTLPTHRHLFWGNVFPCDGSLQDLLVYTTRFQYFHTRAFFEPIPGRTPEVSAFAYPPPAALIYDFFFKASHIKREYIASNVASGIALLCIAYLLFREVCSRVAALLLTGSVLLLSFPFIFLVERGNIEMFVGLSVALGLFAYYSEQPALAAVCFGLACSVKPFPIALFGLFLGKRLQLRPLMLAFLTLILSTVLSLAFAGPSVSVAAHGFVAGIIGFGQHRLPADFQNLGFDHSFFSLLKLAARYTQFPLKSMVTLYYFSAIPLAVWIFFRSRGYSVVNRICLLSCLVVALPPISYEYTLVSLYVPVVLMAVNFFSQRDATADASRVELSAFACLLFVFLPPTLFGDGETPFEGQLKAVAIGVALFCTAKRSWRPEMSIPRVPSRNVVSDQSVRTA